MTKAQYGLSGSALLLFFLLYFGCKTKPPAQQEIEKSRLLNAEQTDVNVLLKEAKASMTSGQQAEVFLLEEALANLSTEEDTAKIDAYKQLASKWFSLGHPGISGDYAQKIADVENTEEAWSIAGTTYTICVQRSDVEKVREFCTKRAIQSFESAISLNPTNVQHKVNLALCYTENPPADNPMKGILMLRTLDDENPEDALINTSLARLAIRTGQYDRAIQRLQTVLRNEPANNTANCLIGQAYEKAGKAEMAVPFIEKCNTVN